MDRQGQAAMMRHRVIYWFSWALAAIGLGYCLWRVLPAATRGWAEVARDASPAWLAASCALLAATYAAGAFAWRATLAATGAPAGCGAALRPWFLSLWARYVPGMVWAGVSRVSLAAAEGLPAASVSAATVLESALVVASGAIMATVLAGPAVVGGPAVAVLCVAASLAAVFCAAPAVRALTRRAVACPGPLAIARLGVSYLAFWALFAAAFAAFVRGLAPIHPTGALLAAGAFPAAFLAGFLAVAVPAGVGVREGVLAAALSAVLTPERAAAVAILSRLWIVVIEVLVVAGARVALGGTAQREVADVA